MKNILMLLTLVMSVVSNSQEKGFEDVNEDFDTVAFAIIENVPIYKGCDDSMSNIELKKCMSDGISKHVAKNFNTNIAKGLGLPDGKIRINVIFKIDKTGNVIDIRSRAPHPALEEEAIRVIKLIPQMEKPGYQKGKPVIVPYSLPIVFVLETPKPAINGLRKK